VGGTSAGNRLVDVEAEIIAASVVDGTGIVTDLPRFVVDQNVDNIVNVTLQKNVLNSNYMIIKQY
jgi:hypothetical protein